MRLINEGRVPSGDLVSHEPNIQSLRVSVNPLGPVAGLAHPLRVPVLVFLGITLLGDLIVRNLVACEAVDASAGINPPTGACEMCFGCWCYQSRIEDQQSSSTWGYTTSTDTVPSRLT